MKILTLDNRTYTLEKIPEWVDEKLRFAVLDNSDPNNIVVNTLTTSADASDKLLFSNDQAMMREKISIYRQFAQDLLGDPDGQFVTPHNGTPVANATVNQHKRIDAAIFISFKRLFNFTI